LDADELTQFLARLGAVQTRQGPKATCYEIRIEHEGWLYVFELRLDRSGTDLIVTCPLGEPIANPDQIVADDLFVVIQKYEPLLGPLRLEHRHRFDSRLCLELVLDNRTLTRDQLIKILNALLPAVRETYGLLRQAGRAGM
jgi:hypothetical protein